MGSFTVLILLPLLCVEGMAADYINKTNATAKGVMDVPDTTLPEQSYRVYAEPSKDNLTFNNSIFELIKVTTTNSPKRRPRMPPLGPLTNEFLDNLDQYAMPVALCLGILGNIIMFPIFVYSPLKGNSLSHYLAAMAVSDFLYLVSCLIVWTSGQGMTIYHTIGVCQYTQFFLRISKFLATWYLFAAHVERLLVHFRPIRAKVWCSTFRTKFIIIFIFIFSLVGFLHYIWTSVIQDIYGRPTCTIMRESVKHLTQLLKIELIAALFLPMLLIVKIDIALFINSIAKRYKLYLRVPSKNGSVKSESGQDELGEYVLASRHRSGSQPNRSVESKPPAPEFDFNLQRRSTTLCVVICGLIFIGIVLPYSVYTAKITFLPFGARQPRPSRNDTLAMRFLEQLVKLNSVYKFLLYLILLKPFRNGFAYLYLCRMRKRSEVNNFQETTEV